MASPFPPGPFGEAMGASALSSFEIKLDEMVPRRSARPLEGEVVEPDLSREAAKAEASERFLRAVRPMSALYARYTPEVRSAAFAYYPLFVTRYDYSGEATRRPGETCHVTVSGRTGKVVGGHHPSALRALAAKVRRFVTF